ncbi:hypothetical protein PI125_g1345 [Phytophthora idaei]|nr:hypothetical protein PI125_g1345 [Phytophthora idaei]
MIQFVSVHGKHYRCLLLLLTYSSSSVLLAGSVSLS